MWHRHTVNVMNDQFVHPTIRHDGLFEYPGAVWTLSTEDGKGALATEDADSIALLDASPLGSELSSLPPLDLSHQPLSALDMSFLDPDMEPISAAGSSSQPPSGQLDSALEEYTKTWRKLVHESSMLASSLFPSDQPHSMYGFDADPTPPLAFDFDLPANPATTCEVVGDVKEPSPFALSLEVVAPKPIRLANPAIHLAALVEDHESVTPSSGSENNEEDAEGAFDCPVQSHGYSLEQLQEYMSDSESSCDGSESGSVEEEEDVTPSLANFQFTYPTYHDLPNSSALQIPPSPLSPLPPPASPLSPLSPTVPQISRASQLRETMRERRAARYGPPGHGHVAQGHSRHSSVPDIHFRPPGWNGAVHPESLAHIALRRGRRENASHSVDWSAGVMLDSLSEPSQPIEQYSTGYAMHTPYPYPLAERTYQ